MKRTVHMAWASYQIRTIVGCACAGNAGNVSPPPRLSDPDMHHGTCVTRVSWCMSGSLSSRFHLSRWRGKRSRHSRRMRNPQVCVSGRRPMTRIILDYCPIILTIPWSQYPHRINELGFSLPTIGGTVIAIPVAWSMINSHWEPQQNGYMYLWFVGFF